MVASIVWCCRCSFCSRLLCFVLPPFLSPTPLALRTSQCVNCRLIVSPCCDDPECLLCCSIGPNSEPANHLVSIFVRLFPHIQLPNTNIPFVAGQRGGRVEGWGGKGGSPFFFCLSIFLSSLAAPLTMLALIAPKMFPLQPSFPLLVSLSLLFFSSQLSSYTCQDAFLFLSAHATAFFTPLPFFTRTRLVLELTRTPLSLCFFVFPAWHPHFKPCLECSRPQTDSSAEGWGCWYVSPHAARPLCSENRGVFFPEPQAYHRRTLFFCVVFFCFFFTARATIK